MGSFLVSLSGPLANLTAAFVGGMIFRFFRFPSELYIILLITFMLMNIGLGIFNLLPIPPLDGSHILESFLPYKALQKYREVGRYAPLVLIGIFLADRFLQTGIISAILYEPMRYLLWIFSGLWLR